MSIRVNINEQDFKYNEPGFIDLDLYRRSAKPSFNFPNYNYLITSQEGLLPDTVVKMSVVLQCQGKAPLAFHVDRSLKAGGRVAKIVDDATTPSGLRFSLEELPDFSLTP